jgi:hypothetical protein
MQLLKFYAGYIPDDYSGERGSKQRFLNNNNDISGFLLAGALGVVSSIQLAALPKAKERSVAPLLFDIFAIAVPMAAAATVVALTGYIFAEKWWKMALAGVRITPQAIKVASVASTVLASIVAGFTALFAFKHAFSAVVVAMARTKGRDSCLGRFYLSRSSNGEEGLKGRVGVSLFLNMNFAYLGMSKDEEWPKCYKVQLAMFEIFAGIMPMVLGVVGVAVAGYFFAEQLCRTILEGLIAQEAIRALAVTGTVIGAVIAGAIMPVICKNIVALIAGAATPSVEEGVI